MKDIIGIVGGMGAHAGANIFQRIIEKSPVSRDQDYIEILVHNNPNIQDRTEAIINNGESPIKELIRSMKILEKSGANKIILGCITAHCFLSEIENILETAKIINVIEETVNYVINNKNDIKCVGIIASSGAIKSGIWQRYFHNKNIKTVILSNDDQEEYFNKVIYGENSLKAGNFNESNNGKIKKACEILKISGAELVIGGCSELSLVISESDLDEYIDSFGIVIDKVINKYYK